MASVLLVPMWGAVVKCRYHPDVLMRGFIDMREHFSKREILLSAFVALVHVLQLIGCSSDPVISPPPQSPAWIAQESGTTERLVDVFFVDAIIGTVVGLNGTILRTVDGGTTWENQTSGTNADLLGVYFTDEKTGTAVGADGSFFTILRTIDGGLSWAKQLNVESRLFLTDVFFTDTNVGTVVGQAGLIFRTTDGGVNWSEQESGTTSKLLEEINFTDANTGTIVGDHIILRTANGGTTWVKHEQPVRWLLDINFAGPSTATAVGVLGTIIRTDDGGESWITQSSGVFSDLWSVFFVEPNVGFAVGGRSVLRTDNGGGTWNRQTASSAGVRGYFSVWFTDESTGTIVGDGGTILRTTTGGQ